MKTNTLNLEASVHARLLSLAKRNGQPFEHILKRYAMERFLYRLSKSQHSKDFVLKGGLLLTTFNIPSSRPTLDIDLQSLSHNNESGYVTLVVKETCRVDVEPDGLRFDPETVVSVALSHIDGYEGIRARFVGFLGRADISVQIDVGFGGAIVPPAVSIEYPTLLEMPVPKLSGYRRETVIAEKLDAMTKHDLANTRMKDFYDVLLMARTNEFEGHELSAAIRQTFKMCRRDISSSLEVFRREFAEDPMLDARWKTFLQKNGLLEVPQKFSDVVDNLRMFILPLIEKLATADELKGKWIPPDTWNLDGKKGDKI